MTSSFTDGAGPKQSREFKKIVLEFYKKYRRDLPWRQPTLKLRHGKKDFDPYRILVSEIMLQQTQVLRVIPKYKSFLKNFPTVRALARAPLSAVLKEWQGLGYNRRAKMLHEAAKAIVKEHKGAVPHSHAELVALPGIGVYTARAVRVFAWNEPDALIETNVRASVLHHFFPEEAEHRGMNADKRRKIHDREVLAIVERVLDKENPREWYAALMDYGSHLKATRPNPSRASAHHAKQKPFKGSDREIRGAILRALSGHSHTKQQLFKMPFAKKRLEVQLKALLKEKLITLHVSRYTLHD